jgi:hypothetical protein
MPSELKFLLAQIKLNATEYIAHYGQVLQCPARRLAVTGNSKGYNGTIRFRNQEATIWMRFRAFVATVLTAQRGLNLTDGVNSLVARLALPEHQESLTAHAAMHFSVAARAFAKDLHKSYLRPPQSLL